MSAPRSTGLFLAIVLAASACDRTPVGPLDVASMETVAGTGEPSSELTLAALLSSAIRQVHEEHGGDAAREVVRGIAGIEHELDAAPVEERPALRRALREEQLRVVLLVQGDDVVARTVRAVAEDAAQLAAHRDALAHSGISAPDVATMLEEVPILLTRARKAASDMEALDAATRAAERTNSMRRMLVGAARLPSLTDLFEQAVVRLAARPAGRRMVSESRALRVAAEDAIRAGARDHAQTVAEAARAAQIRVILAALGPDAVADVIEWARYRLEQQQNLLGAVAEVRDVSRLERMHASARDMLHRADDQLRGGESAAALDLAAHAVDLLNSLESTLTAH